MIASTVSTALQVRRPDGSSGRRVAMIADEIDLPRGDDLEPLQSFTDPDEDEDGPLSSVSVV